MPHYADGTPAQVGDKVKGKPYNTDHEVAGEVLSITPGTETCNCVVAFTEVHAVKPEVAVALQRVTNAVFNGGEGKQFLLLPRYDYGETKAFTKL